MCHTRFTSRTTEFRSVYKSYAGLNAEVFRGNIVKIISILGRTTQSKGTECAGLLRELLESEKNVDSAKLILANLKLIGGVFKATLEPHRELILAATQSPYDGTCCLPYLVKA